MRLKYVRHETLGVAFFPADTDLSHRLIGRAMDSAEHEWGGKGKVLSAGFVYVGRDAVHVEGRSESLNLDRLPDDAEVIKKQLGYFATEEA